MRSARSCSRARTTDRQRGFALIWAIGLSVLFFMLIQLMLIDSARELAEARRFRAKVIAATLAENGAELAAANMVNRMYSTASAEDWQGTIEGKMAKNPGGQFEIVGEGEGKGVNPSSARVRVQGRVVNNKIVIDYTRHTQ